MKKTNENYGPDVAKFLYVHNITDFDCVIAEILDDISLYFDQEYITVLLQTLPQKMNTWGPTRDTVKNSEHSDREHVMLCHSLLRCVC